MILDAYAHALGVDAGKDLRPRVEHCGMCTPAILDKLVRLKAFAAPQPTFVHYLGDSYLRNFSERQLALAYPLDAFQREGIRSHQLRRAGHAARPMTTPCRRYPEDDGPTTWRRDRR